MSRGRNDTAFARTQTGIPGTSINSRVAALVTREPDWIRVLRHPAAKLHLYGKAQPRRGRKMGHVTCLAPTLAEALANARDIKRGLGSLGSGELYPGLSAAEPPGG